MKRVAFAVLVMFAACKKQAAAPAEHDPSAAPKMPVAELKRGQDACKAYVDRVCACVEKVPAVKEQCGLAKALPDAIEVSEQVSSSPESSKLDVLHAQDSIRKTVKECIEETAKLPALGCP